MKSNKQGYIGWFPTQELPDHLDAFILEMENEPELTTLANVLPSSQLSRGFRCNQYALNTHQDVIFGGTNGMDKGMANGTRVPLSEMANGQTGSSSLINNIRVSPQAILEAVMNDPERQFWAGLENNAHDYLELADSSDRCCQRCCRYPCRRPHLAS